VKTALLFAIFAMTSTGCSQPRAQAGRGTASPSAREAIKAWYDVAEDAFYRGDAETLAQSYTDDAELFVVDSPVVRGKEAIAKNWKQALGTGGNKLNVETWEVQETGDWAYETGRFTASTPSGQSLFVGKYIVIWKRDANGNWKAHRDISNWEVPPGR
jgi:uncharacterized protein (TIGR02246 family)